MGVALYDFIKVLSMFFTDNFMLVVKQERLIKNKRLQAVVKNTFNDLMTVLGLKYSICILNNNR